MLRGRESYESCHRALVVTGMRSLLDLEEVVLPRSGATVKVLTGVALDYKQYRLHLRGVLPLLACAVSPVPTCSPRRSLTRALPVSVLPSRRFSASQERA